MKNKIICKNFSSTPFDIDNWDGTCDNCPHNVFNGANAFDGCMGSKDNKPVKK